MRRLTTVTARDALPLFRAVIRPGRQNMTTRFLAVTTVAGLALAVGIGSGGAQAKPAKPAIDPDAMEALKKMGAFLRDQQKFTVRSDMTTDDLLPSGQKVQFEGTA